MIVRGLLSRFESRAAGQARQRQPKPKPKLGEWENLADRLEGLPETTDLVFVDGAVASSNPLLRALGKIGKAQRFARPNQRQVGRWDRRPGAAVGTYPSSRGPPPALAESVGNDLRVIVSELEKLSLYRSGGTIRHEDVAELVSYARDASIFAAVDAILEGRSGAAIRMVHGLLQGGASPAYLLVMLAPAGQAAHPRQGSEGRGRARERAGAPVGPVGVPAPQDPGPGAGVSRPHA